MTFTYIVQWLHILSGITWFGGMAHDATAGGE